MKIQIHWHYKTKKGLSSTLQSDFLTPQQALILCEDFEQTGRVKSIELLDQYNSHWTLKELKKYCKEMIEEPSSVQIYFDGGFDQASREGGIGIVIYYEQNNKHYRIRKNQKMLYLTSNNEAEYAALHFAIEELVNLGVRGQSIEVFGDSQVVIQQMAGEWPVYEAALEGWANKIDVLLTKYKLTAAYTHVSRKQNEEADRLATQALQDTAIDAKSEVK